MGDVPRLCLRYEGSENNGLAASPTWQSTKVESVVKEATNRKSWSSGGEMKFRWSLVIAGFFCVAPLSSTAALAQDTDFQLMYDYTCNGSGLSDAEACAVLKHNIEVLRAAGMVDDPATAARKRAEFEETMRTPIIDFPRPYRRAPNVPTTSPSMAGASAGSASERSSNSNGQLGTRRMCGSSPCTVK